MRSSDKSFVQHVSCHKSHVGRCKRNSLNSVIFFDEQSFPWCPLHFPADRKTNLGVTPQELIGEKEWKQLKEVA